MTLMEIMIVIAIIGIISGVVGYKMRGGLDKGRAFKTIQNIRKVYDIFCLEMDEKEIKTIGKDKDQMKAKVETYLKNSGLVRNPEGCLVDGWGEPFALSVENKELKMISSKYEGYCDDHGQPKNYPWEEGTKPEQGNGHPPDGSH